MSRSTQAAVEAALQAADALGDYRRRLEKQPLPQGFAPPAPPPELSGLWPADSSTGHEVADRSRAPVPSRSPFASRTHRASHRHPVVASEPDDVLALPQPDWLFHHLAVSGLPDALIRFRQAAAGPGVIPWVCDHSRLEEDLFLSLMREDTGRPRELSAVGAHVLATRLRQVVQRLDASMSIHSGSLPDRLFDLQALLPVPAAVLDLGSDHLRARQWLWSNWGTTRPLRDVSEILPEPGETAPAAGAAALRLQFWSADWTPWPAVRQLRLAWPELHFAIRPIYEVG